MTEFELLIDLHKDGHRQGPGSPRTTLQAFELTGLSPSKPLKVADIGCGAGAQTMVLARHTEAEIVAVDLFPVFLEKLRARAEALEFSDRITTQIQSMDALEFAPESLDLLWSEGAIYLMGFVKGLRYWRRFLKPGGFLAVSEISWLTESRPQEIEDYWQAQYPGIDTVSGKIRELETNGYLPTAHLVLSPDCWLKHYYGPLEDRFEAFLDRHQHSEAAREIVAQEKEEIRIYKKYQGYFSYGFYIAQKRDGWQVEEK